MDTFQKSGLGRHLESFSLKPTVVSLNISSSFIALLLFLPSSFVPFPFPCHSCYSCPPPTALKLCQQESATTHQDQTLSHSCLKHNSQMHTLKQRVQHVSILCARLGDRNPVNTLSFEGVKVVVGGVFIHSGRLIEVLRHGMHPVYILTTHQIRSVTINWLF